MRSDNSPPRLQPPLVSRARWVAWVESWSPTPREQMGLGLKAMVDDGRSEDALRALLEHRKSGAALTETDEHEGVVGGSALEGRLAVVLNRLASEHPQLQLEQLRRTCIGRPGVLTRAKAWAFLEPHSASSGRILVVQDRTGRHGLFRADPDAPLAALWVNSRALLGLLLWPQPSIAWWLLTGEVPELPSITARLDGPRGRGAHQLRITITAMTHVSKESVAATFSAARRQAFATPRGAVAVGRRAMVDFVDRHRGTRAELPPWPELLALWNDAVPRVWRYSDWRAMARAYGHEQRRFTRENNKVRKKRRL